MDIEIAPRKTIFSSLSWYFKMKASGKVREDAAGKLVPTGKSEAAGVFLSFNQAIRQALLSEGKKSGVDRWVLLPAEGPLGDYPPTD